jgi:hypothetical protein
MHFFAVEATKRMLAFILTRDRLPAAKTEARPAFVAREGSFAITAEWLIAIFTLEASIFTDVAESLVALLADVHMFALKTGRHEARFTVESVFALTTEFRLACCAIVELFAVVAESLFALATVEAFDAVVAGCLVALVTDEHIFLALMTKWFLTLVTAEAIVTLITECLLAPFTVVEVAVVAECLGALVADVHLCALMTHWHLALLTMIKIFALGAEFLEAL